jgi:hypothetical protein
MGSGSEDRQGGTSGVVCLFLLQQLQGAEHRRGEFEPGEGCDCFTHAKDRWSRHFAWQGPILVGRTVTGRVTITLLEINRAEAVELRGFLIREARS